MATTTVTTELVIRRPVGDYRAFERPATLSDQRYRLLFEPSGRGVGCWYLTIFNVLGTLLVASIRLVPTTDLLRVLRARVPDLPTGRLRLEATRDPELGDLATDNVHLYYDEEIAA